MGGLRPDQARADYRRSLGETGELVALRRPALDSEPEAADLRARVKGGTTDELASGMDQRRRTIILLAEDVEAAIDEGLWPEPAPGADAIVKNDHIVVRGAPLNVDRVDSDTRRVGGVLIAYVIEAIG
ncbi:hypothetical protein [Methylopila sp. 73B]|uniref:hypothetical protein n=1 Tax=Methylopila sp. 73B TaxID=1120792 RepID=UPI00036F523F|nr:hypothetical protein [Methylopila sp. 73B]